MPYIYVVRFVVSVFLCIFCYFGTIDALDYIEEKHGVAWKQAATAVVLIFVLGYIVSRMVVIL